MSEREMWIVLSWMVSKCLSHVAIHLQRAASMLLLAFTCLHLIRNVELGSRIQEAQIQRGQSQEEEEVTSGNGRWRRGRVCSDGSSGSKRWVKATTHCFVDQASSPCLAMCWLGMDTEWSRRMDIPRRINGDIRTVVRHFSYRASKLSCGGYSL